MNICFFYRIYPSYGGVEVVTTLLANRFYQDGHKVVIVSFEHPHLELISKLNKNIQVLFLEYPIFSLNSINKMRSVIKKENINVIINQWGLPFYTSLFCKVVSLKLDVLLISVLHGSPVTSKTFLYSHGKFVNSNNFFCKKYYKVLCAFKQFVIKMGLMYNLYVNNKYILLSEGFITTLKAFLHKEELSNVVAIGNPITIQTSYDNYIESKKKQILYVGRLDFENKRVDRIIVFWQKIFLKYVDWELILVGEGPHEKQLKDYVVNNKIDRVVFNPFEVEPPIKYYKEASIFLLTSDLEGFGLVIVESMSYGVVPVVYGSYEAVYDIIEDGVSGFITSKPFDEHEFELAVLQLMNNESQRNTMSLNALKKSQQFSVDHIMEKWYEVLREFSNE